jgi:hypothetical protein
LLDQAGVNRDAFLRKGGLGPVIRPRFVVSTGRCGSTLLAEVLAGHPSVLSVSELFAAVQPRAFPVGNISGERFWSILSRPDNAWALALKHRFEPEEFLYPVDGSGRFDRLTGVPPLAGVCLPAITDDVDGLYAELEQVVPRFPVAEVGALYGLLLEWLTRRLGKELWVERSGGSLLYIAELANCFPGARFLHLHRDGRETALSMSRHAYFRMQLVRELMTSTLGYDPYDGPVPTRGSVPAELEPLLPGKFDRDALLRAPIPIERFGLRWSATILNGTRRLASLPPEDVSHMSYERLVAEPREQLRRLLTALDLPEPPPGWLNWASAQVEDRPLRWAQLSSEDQGRLSRACEPGARRLRSLS